MEFHSLLSDWYAPMAGSFKIRGTVRVIVIDKRETLVLLLRNLHNVTLMGDMELHNDNDCKAHQIYKVVLIVPVVMPMRPAREQMLVYDSYPPCGV
jgi:hypothetical protein